MTRALRAEWTKLRTTRSTPWSLPPSCTLALSTHRPAAAPSTPRRARRRPVRRSHADAQPLRCLPSDRSPLSCSPRWPSPADTTTRLIPPPLTAGSTSATGLRGQGRRCRHRYVLGDRPDRAVADRSCRAESCCPATVSTPPGIPATVPVRLGDPAGRPRDQSSISGSSPCSASASAPRAAHHRGDHDCAGPAVRSTRPHPMFRLPPHLTRRSRDTRR